MAIAAGGAHCLALKQDGSIVGWGAWKYDQDLPPDGNDYVAIAAGESHSLALKQDGSIVGWGLDDDGQATPPAGIGFEVIAASIYNYFSLAIAGCQRYAPACDLNDDCKVDYLDLEIMVGDWLSGEADLAADINTDSTVDMKDYAILADNWLIDCDQTPEKPACVHK